MFIRLEPGSVIGLALDTSGGILAALSRLFLWSGIRIRIIRQEFFEKEPRCFSGRQEWKDKSRTVAKPWWTFGISQARRSEIRAKKEHKPNVTPWLRFGLVVFTLRQLNL
jgi:hypothetical protein